MQPPTYNVHRKLKAVRIALTKWNQETFGNIFNRNDSIEADVAHLENTLLTGWDDLVFDRWVDVKHKWRNVCSQRGSLLEAKN